MGEFERRIKKELIIYEDEDVDIDKGGFKRELPLFVTKKTVLDAVDEVRKECPLSFTKEQWKQFIENSPKEWLIKTLNASYEFFLNWFGEEKKEPDAIKPPILGFASKDYKKDDVIE